MRVDNSCKSSYNILSEQKPEIELEFVFKNKNNVYSNKKEKCGNIERNLVQY